MAPRPASIQKAVLERDIPFLREEGRKGGLAAATANRERKVAKALDAEMDAVSLDRAQKRKALREAVEEVARLESANEHIIPLDTYE